MPKSLVPPRVVLASASPRRQELLKKVVAEFDVDPADLDEDALTLDDPIATAKKLAQAKAALVALRHPESWIIGSDTVVAMPLEDGTAIQFSKPVDEDDALEILSQLSGRIHYVITGIAVVTPDQAAIAHAIAEVEFNAVSDEQIREYIQTGEPMDKAGAYGAQGMGAFLVKEIRGDFETVVGLPTELLRNMLQAIDYPFES